MAQTGNLHINNQYLRDRLSQLDLKHWWVAERIGVDSRTLRRWLNGQTKNATRQNVSQLAKCLECSETELTLPGPESAYATRRDQSEAALWIQKGQLADLLLTNSKWRTLAGVLKGTITPDLPLKTLGSLYNSIALSMNHQHDVKAARLWSERALKIGERISDPGINAIACLNQSISCLFEGDLADSESKLLESLALCKKNSLKRGMAAGYLILSGVRLAAKDYKNSRGYCIRALRTFLAEKDERFVAICHQVLGTAWLEQGELTKAEQAFKASMKYGQSSGYNRVLHEGKLYLALIEAKRGRNSLADTLYRQGVDGLKEVEAFFDALPEYVLGTMLRLRGDLARSHLTLVKALNPKLSARRRMQIYEELALVTRLQGRLRQARRWHKNSIKSIT